MELTGVSRGALSLGSGAKVSWDGGMISGNIPTDSTVYAIFVDVSATLVLKATPPGSLTVSGNGNPKNYGYQILNNGDLTIESTVSINCSDILNTGTGTCRGAPLP